MNECSWLWTGDPKAFRGWAIPRGSMCSVSDTHCKVAATFYVAHAKAGRQNRGRWAGWFRKKSHDNQKFRRHL